MNTCIDPLSLVMACIKYTCHKNKVFLHHSLKKNTRTREFMLKMAAFLRCMILAFQTPVFVVRF